VQGTSGGIAGKTVLITGGTSGIGKAAATALAGMGAEVVVTGRNPEKAEKAVADIKRDSGGGEVSVILADLAKQADVRRIAQEFEATHDRLDVLVNNAGGIFSKREETPDGIEWTFAVNHLAPFLLTDLLLEKLKGSAPSRIITTSSQAQSFPQGDFFDLQSEKRYSAFPAYGKSKLANILFTFELAERLKGTGVTANCFHPGAVNTNFGASGGVQTMLFNLFKPFMRSPEGGADTLVYLAASPDVEGMTGKYLSDRKIIIPSDLAYDEAARKRLWEESERLTGLKVAI